MTKIKNGQRETRRSWPRPAAAIGAGLLAMVLMLAVSLFGPNLRANAAAPDFAADPTGVLHQAGNQAGNTFTHTFYAYIRAGEHLNYTITPKTAAGLATTPANFTVYVDTSPTTSPSTSCSANNTTATSCAVTDTSLTATTDGIWRIRIRHTNTNTTPVIYQWSINVYDSTAARLPGRVYAEDLNIHQVLNFPDTNPASIANSASFRLWLVGQNNYRYTADLYDYNGAYSTLVADQEGLTAAVGGAGSCIPVYHSHAFIVGSTTTSRPFLPANANCGTRDKIFLEQPDLTMPAMAREVYDPGSSGTALDWLNLPDPLVPTLSNQTYTALGPTTGTVAFDVSNFTGNVNITQKDAVGNLINSYTATANNLAGQSLSVPVSNVTPGTTFTIILNKIGELHLTMFDIEQISGLTMTRLNSPVGVVDPSPSQVYWNDTWSDGSNTDNPLNTRPSAIAGCQNPDSTFTMTSAPNFDTSVAGLNSDVAGGVHGWLTLQSCFPVGSGTVPVSYGDNAYVDNWVFLPLDITATVTVDGPNLVPTKAIAGGATQLEVGQSSTYTVTITNHGSGDSLGNIVVNDTLPAGLRPDSATITDAVGACQITSQTVTCTSDKALLNDHTDAIIMTIHFAAVNANPAAANTAYVTGGSSSCTGQSCPTNTVVVAIVALVPPETGVSINGPSAVLTGSAVVAAGAGLVVAFGLKRKFFPAR